MTGGNIRSGGAGLARRRGSCRKVAAVKFLLAISWQLDKAFRDLSPLITPFKGLALAGSLLGRLWVRVRQAARVREQGTRTCCWEVSLGTGGRG